MLDISLLGTSGMIPLHNRYLTAMLARYNGNLLLIDCGEGTQVTMRELGWGFVNLNVLLITHFHADHISGLPGLLLSLSNYGRKEPLHIVGPKGTEAVVNNLCIIAPKLMYTVEIIELENETQSIEVGGWQISVLPLKHALPCFGYSLHIPRSGKFDITCAREQDIPIKYWSRLQSGETVEGFTPDMVLGESRKGIKVSYITDTRPIDPISSFIKDSDLFICEGMYGHNEMKERANRFYHMIFSDAAKLAKAGDVKELWMTHYSQAFTDPEAHIDSIKPIFENAKAGYDRMTKTITFVDED
jgi:ribonuclease Z